MNEQITHKQHYVQRKYLSLWADDLTTDGFVMCEINHKEPKPIKITNIMFEHDFYKIPILTYNEIEVCSSIISRFPTISKESADEYIRNLYISRAIHDSDNVPNSIKIELDKTLIQLGEEFQRCAENMMDDSLREKILSCNPAFLNNYEEKYSFLAYLFMQYLRSPSSKRIIAGNLNNYSGLETPINGDNIWAVLQNVIASGATNYMFRLKVRVKFLLSKDNAFKTCDNPVVRLALAKDKTDRFYYPFSPSVALIVGTNDDDSGVSNLSREQVDAFNKLIENNATRIVVSKCYTNNIKNKNRI